MCCGILVYLGDMEVDVTGLRNAVNKRVIELNCERLALEYYLSIFPDSSFAYQRMTLSLRWIEFKIALLEGLI